MYTEKYVERWELAAGISVLDHSTVQDLAARVDVGGYTRIKVTVLSESGSGNTIDIDVEQANALTGGTLKTLDTNAFDVTIADAEPYALIEFRTENFDTNGGFNYLNIEATPSAARMFAIIVEGLVKQAPASVATWSSVTP
jgi:hypothetical protein